MTRKLHCLKTKPGGFLGLEFCSVYSFSTSRKPVSSQLDLIFLLKRCLSLQQASRGGSPPDWGGSLAWVEESKYLDSWFSVKKPSLRSVVVEKYSKPCCWDGGRAWFNIVLLKYEKSSLKNMLPGWEQMFWNLFKLLRWCCLSKCARDTNAPPYQQRSRLSCSVQRTCNKWFPKPI